MWKVQQPLPKFILWSFHKSSLEEGSAYGYLQYVYNALITC